MAKKSKSAKGQRPRARRELRFEPRSTASTSVVYALGALGALAMGVGAWGQFAASLSDSAPPPLAGAPYILFGGAAIVGLAIWMGTSGRAALRVGDAGIGVDKGSIRRMPWYGVEHVEWRDETVRVIGKDETGEPMTVLAPVAAYPQAAA